MPIFGDFGPIVNGGAPETWVLYMPVVSGESSTGVTAKTTFRARQVAVAKAEAPIRDRPAGPCIGPVCGIYDPELAAVFGGEF